MPVNTAFKEILYSLIDFIFPPACIICGNHECDNVPLCFECKSDISIKAHSYVSNRKSENIDSIFILLPFDKITRTLIHGLKYHGMKRIGSFLGKLIAEKYHNEFYCNSNSIIIPVPLHENKKKERGYNQSLLISEGFSSLTGIPISNDILSRNKYTLTQTKLSIQERSENVKEAFSLKNGNKIKGKDIVLIDDVLTTGATLSECSKLLKNHGAGNIFVCVAASPSLGEE